MDLVERKLIRPAEKSEISPEHVEGFQFLLVSTEHICYGDWEGIPEHILGVPPDRTLV